jgi:hypothetical protein
MLKTVSIRTANADTTTGAVTGINVDISDAKKVGILLRVAAHTSGNTVFTVKGSMENLDLSPAFLAINTLITNTANTNAQMPTRVASVTVSSAVDTFLWLDDFALLNMLQVNYNTTTDGAVTIFILKQIEE